MSFKKGKLLQVATALKVVTPEIPSWYREEYLDRIEVNRDNELEMDKANTQVLIAWQTYYLQMSALSLIEVCDQVDDHVMKGKRDNNNSGGLHVVK